MAAPCLVSCVIQPAAERLAVLGKPICLPIRHYALNNIPANLQHHCMCPSAIFGRSRCQATRAALQIETWTDMNVVCFMGGAADRQLIVDHELFFRDGADPATGRLGRKTRTPKFNIMLTSFELLRDCQAVFGQFLWDIVIVDEAHRLKSLTSAARCAAVSPVRIV